LIWRVGWGRGCAAPRGCRPGGRGGAAGGAREVAPCRSSSSARRSITTPPSPGARIFPPFHQLLAPSQNTRRGAGRTYRHHAACVLDPSRILFPSRAVPCSHPHPRPPLIHLPRLFFALSLPSPLARTHSPPRPPRRRRSDAAASRRPQGGAIAVCCDAQRRRQQHHRRHPGVRARGRQLPALPLVSKPVAPEGIGVQRPPGRAGGDAERTQQVLPLRGGVLRAVVAGVDAKPHSPRWCAQTGCRI
jgi:hypothetical protein